MKKIIVAALASLLFLSGCGEYEKGEKSGIIVKCSVQGLISKTCECELVRGGLDDGSGAMGKSFHFTIEDSRLQGQAYKALKTQQVINLYYRREYITFMRSDSDDCFAYKIEVRE